MYVCMYIVRERERERERERGVYVLLSKYVCLRVNLYVCCMCILVYV